MARATAGKIIKEDVSNDLATANVAATVNETATAYANVGASSNARRARANVATSSDARRARANVAASSDARSARANVAATADANVTAERRADADEKTQKRAENANEPATATDEEPGMIFREIVVYGDNERSIGLTKNAESQHRTKHINVKHHYIRELVNEKELNV
ncbi:hypothetical protein MMC31_004396 [Peltigera leucophlebia]|nr:hypothetical protein [Peltigera leucophlebia]